MKSDFFLLRTPLLSLNEVWNGPLDENLKRLLSKPEVLEALYVAAPDFAEGFANGQSTARIEKAQMTMARYLSRMSSRCTPFGLFSGVNWGTFGKKTDLRLSSREKWSAKIRLRAEVIAVIESLAVQHEVVRQEFKWFLNPTLVAFPSWVHLTKRNLKRDDKRGRHRLDSESLALKRTKPLDIILGLDEPPWSYKHLVDSLLRGQSRSSGAKYAAETYLDSLIEQQIVVSQLSLSMNGRFALQTLINLLQSCATARDLAETVALISRRLDSANKSPVVGRLHEFRQIHRAIDRLPITTSRSERLHVDLCKVTSEVPVLERAYISELRSAANFLHRLFGAMKPVAEVQFESITRAFVERFGNRRVPLLEAFNSWNGISVPPVTAPLKSIGAVERQNHLMGRLIDSKGAPVLKMNDSDLLAAGIQTSVGLENSFACIGSVLPDQKFYLKYVCGSGLEGVNRFAYLDDNLRAKVAQFAKNEQDANENGVFVEVAHKRVPDYGTVADEICYRDFELCYWGAMNSPKDRRISLRDLYVHFENGRLVLRSPKLENRRVIPRLTSALNPYFFNDPILMILHLFSEQTWNHGLTWSWGELSGLRFLPRVEFNNTILAPAQWLIKPEDLEGDNLNRLRSEGGLSQMVTYTGGDRSLAVNLDDPLSVGTLRDLFKTNPKNEFKFPVQEFLFEGRSSPVSGREGSYANEVIIPCYIPKPKKKPTPVPRALKAERATIRALSKERSVVPGGDWFYAKIYTRPENFEHVLSQHLPCLVEKCRRGKLFDRWFFVGYADPDFHIRLRFEGDRKTLLYKFFPEISKWSRKLIDERLVWKFQIDTYERELERYGGPDGLRLAERVFCADTQAIHEWFISRGDSRVLTGIQSLRLWPDLERFIFSVESADQLMADLGLTLSERFDRVNRLTEHRLPEVRVEDRQSLMRLLRELKFQFHQGRLAASSAHASTHALRTRELNEKSVLTLRRSLFQSKKFDPLSFLASVLHMQANRIILFTGTEVSEMELQILGFLRQMYFKTLKAGGGLDG